MLRSSSAASAVATGTFGAFASLARSALVVFVALSLALLAAGCKKASATADAGPPSTPPVLTDGTTGMMLTWIDDKGEFHTEETVAAVPAEAREHVRVRDPNREPPPEQVYVADLRSTGKDGKYTVRLAPADEFEKIAVERRKKSGRDTLVAKAPAAPSASAAASAAAPSPSGLPGRPPVIIYGASWCGPCHQAQAYMKRRGIPFVEKDIEEDAGAAREMQAKLAKAGLRSGSIPVIDVRGKILVGFDPGSVERALGQPL
jgi:glutaredoxin